MRLERRFIIDRCWMLAASDREVNTISIVQRQILFWQESERCAAESKCPATARLKEQKQDSKNNSKTGSKRLTSFHEGV